MRNNPNAYFLFLSAINEEITKLKKYIIFFKKCKKKKDFNLMSSEIALL
jgi:hypothetical protein